MKQIFGKPDVFNMGIVKFYNLWRKDGENVKIAYVNTLCDLMRELKENGSYTDEQWETLGFAVRLIEEFRGNEETP